MRRHLFDLVVLAVVATVITGYLVAGQPSIRDITLHVYVFVIGGLLLLGLVAFAGDVVPRRHRSDFDRALAVRSAPDRALPELQRLEREVTLSSASAYDLHVRLLPALREIAQARLERSGRTPGPETLGRWWELLRPDRPPPDDRFSGGISESRLRELVRDLERM